MHSNKYHINLVCSLLSWIIMYYCIKASNTQLIQLNSHLLFCKIYSANHIAISKHILLNQKIE